MKIKNHPERLFILIVGGLWLLLIGVDRLAPVVLPTENLYFRAWEYVRGQHGYPRRNLTFTVQDAHGDLSNMLNVSAYKVPRDITFTVDDEGMRNIETTMEGSVTLVGQSFIAGAGNTDDSAPGAALADALKEPVYVYAPANMSQLLYRIPEQAPRTVVWGIVERNLTGDNGEIQTLLNMSCPNNVPAITWKQNLITETKKMLLIPTTYARTSIVKKWGRRIFSETFFAVMQKPASPHIQMAALPSKFIFLKKSVNVSHKDSAERDMGIVEEAIVKTASCLNSHGVSLVFVPIPDKVHIYNHVLPSDLQTDYENDPLRELVTSLRGKGVTTVDILTPFLNHVSSEQELLYWPDDTHWNPLGIQKAMQEVAKEF